MSLSFPEDKQLSYLMQVYFFLAVTMLSCAGGALVVVLLELKQAAVLFPVLVGVILGVSLYMSTPPELRDLLRLPLQLFSGFLEGLIFAPLLNFFITVDRSLVATVLFTTSLICFSFSLSAFHAQNRMSMEIAGIMYSISSLLTFFTLMAVFSEAEVEGVAASILVMILMWCNTRRVVEAYNRGETDVISWNHFRSLIWLVEDVLIACPERSSDRADKCAKK